MATWFDLSSRMHPSKPSKRPLVFCPPKIITFFSLIDYGWCWLFYSLKLTQLVDWLLPTSNFYTAMKRQRTTKPDLTCRQCKAQVAFSALALQPCMTLGLLRAQNPDLPLATNAAHCTDADWKLIWKLCGTHCLCLTWQRCVDCKVLPEPLAKWWVAVKTMTFQFWVNGPLKRSRRSLGKRPSRGWTRTCQLKGNAAMSELRHFCREVAPHSSLKWDFFFWTGQESVKIISYSSQTFARSAFSACLHDSMLLPSSALIASFFFFFLSFANQAVQLKITVCQRAVNRRIHLRTN